MKILVAIDSFKGSLTSRECGEAVRAAAAQLQMPDVTILPVADGGEGTVEALTDALRGETRSVFVRGPRGRQVCAQYCVVREKGLAVMEMASACGLPLLAASERDPLETGTYGLGELIADAMAQGCRDFLIGIGGSATNDGGLGMLTALGYRFTDESGRPVGICGGDLTHIADYDDSAVSAALSECRFRIACDVKNPLCGESGASAVFGPQKGATPEAVARLDAGLARLADANARKTGRDLRNVAGTGAAGGLGFGFLAFLGAELQSGVELVLQLLRFEELAREADLVVTGEGRLDAQTAMGKVVAGVAKKAKQYGKTVVALCGCATAEAETCNGIGVDAFFPILQSPVTLAEAMERETACENLRRTAVQMLRLYGAGLRAAARG